mgnify:CR=1 FL=1
MSMWMNVILENGEPADYDGYDIVRHLQQLHEVAKARSIRSLFDFIVDEDVPDPPWFAPAGGLACVRELARYLEAADFEDRRRLADASFHGRLLGPELSASQHQELGRLVAAAALADLRAWKPR